MYIGEWSSDALQGIAKSSAQLATSSERLSSGLRINSAADDPSGLAISTNLQTESMGLDQGQESVQTAVNASTVADGALSTVSAILQRMRSLVVEGRGAILSDEDRSNINDELSALGAEIDHIAQTTNFNGRNLLDGSASSQLATTGGAVVARNDDLSSGQQLLDPSQLVATPTGLPVDLQISVDSYDPTSGLLTVSYEAASPDPAQTFFESQPQTTQILAGQNYDNGYNILAAMLGGTVASLFPDADQYTIADGADNNILTFVMNDLSPSDVGQSAFIYTTDPTSAGSGPLQVGVGDHEGDVLSISMPDVSQAQLNIEDSVVSSDDVVTQGTEYRLDAAIQQIAGARAALGAQTVSLQETQSDTSAASVNLTASASNIRDVDVASETTTYVRAQIAEQVGTRLLASVNKTQRGLLELLSANLLG